MAIRIGDGQLLYTAGDPSPALALAGRLPAGVRVTDPHGNDLAEEELPFARARAGVALAPRHLCVCQATGRTCVMAEVSVARTPEGTPAGVALLTLWPVDDGADTRERFVTIATHELRSPIASLQLDLELMRRRLSQAESVRGPEVAKDMARAARQVTRLTLLIQNLLDVRRMQAHQFALTSDPDEADLATILRDMAETLRPEIAAAQCELSLDVRESIVAAWDKLRIEQVLHNLVSNALKYARSGKRIEVRLDTYGQPRRARIAVRDYGPGVPREERRQIFQPFERGSTAKHDGMAAHSLGLGLYIVYEIAAAHAGTVRVEAPDGGGALFIVELPIRPMTSHDTSHEQ